MAELTSFMNSMLQIMTGLWNSFFSQLKFGTLSIANMMLAFAFLSLFFKFILGSLNSNVSANSRSIRRRDEQE